MEPFRLERTQKRNEPKPYEDVKGCTAPDCPLYDFRLGKNPYLYKGKGNPDALKTYQDSKASKAKK